MAPTLPPRSSPQVSVGWSQISAESGTKVTQSSPQKKAADADSLSSFTSDDEAKGGEQPAVLTQTQND